MKLDWNNWKKTLISKPALFLIALVLVGCVLAYSSDSGGKMPSITGSKSTTPESTLPNGWENMTALEKYSTIKAIEEKQDAIRRQQQAVAEAQHSRDILATLNMSGVNKSQIWTNGYVYEFPYKGYYIHLCDQDSRIVGELYRMPANSSEKAMLEDAHITMMEAMSDEMDGLDSSESVYISQADMLVGKYGYRDFCIDGYPSKATEKLLSEL